MSVLEIGDKTGRKIFLRKKQWSHIRQEHPDVLEEEIEQTLKNPIKISSTEKPDKWHYYSYYKQKKFKFLRVIVRYLNGQGFVITAYFMPQVK